MNAPVTILTGAGSGIGRALAILLAKHGHRLALAGRSLEKLNATKELSGSVPEIVCLEEDVSGDSAAQRVVDAVIARFGRVDTLINCAGIAPRTPIGETTERQLLDCFGVHAVGPACLIIHCWPHFVAQGGGRIINVSSLATSDPFPGFLAYAASKSALDSLTRSAAIEGAAVGVKAFSLNLGCVETPLLRSFADEEMVPKSRARSPESIACIIEEYTRGIHDARSGECVPVANL